MKTRITPRVVSRGLTDIITGIDEKAGLANCACSPQQATRNGSDSSFFHHQQFSDLAHLCGLKRSKGLSVSVGIPTLNEEASIGKTVSVIKRALVDKWGLVDEIVIIDSGSKDRTTEEAEKSGARVYVADEILPELAPVRGKGENLWKSLQVLGGDILVWVDADIQNVHGGFISGLVGPLLEDDALLYSTAFYRRPLQLSPSQSSLNGGRVTELLVRPFLSYLLPEICEFRQPMAGEHAGRRGLLEKLPFFSGYAVDVGHLIDITSTVGKHVVAQVDLDVRVHRHRELTDLSAQSFGVLQALMKRAEDLGRITMHASYTELKCRFSEVIGGEPAGVEVVEVERPPMASIPGYAKCRAHLL
jgi:glucosyl-3-phosphoglycerate synthase